MNSQQDNLPLSLLLAYGCVALPLSTIGLPLSIYLAPFYAGELGFSLAALGTAMVLARLVDVVLVSLWLLSRYVMTAARHARLRAAIERRDLNAA